MATLTAVYNTEPTEASDPWFTWGEPEDDVIAALAPNVIREFDMGTVFTPGYPRDVWIDVDAPASRVRELIAHLDHAHIWTVAD
jgi:hypothetical protein